MVIETIQYFTACHSPIYVLYMDASKVFDRLEHIELFRLLSERAVCPLILRLLFNMYSKTTHSGTVRGVIHYQTCLV